MKRVLVILSISSAVLFYSCNSGPDSEEAKKEDTTAVVTAPQPEAKPAFTPFKIVAIQHKVKDFDKSVTGYFSRDSLLNAFGISHLIIARDNKVSNLVFVMDKIEDVDKSKSFFNNPKVVEVMKNAGVSKPPAYSYAEMVRYDDSPRKYPEGLLVSHHVKDYDAWLKLFERSEGKEIRAEHGLIDRGIARDFYDPNMIYVMFEISDMAKAKARMASPELKKIMADSGVDTPPTMRWFKVVL